MKRQLLVTTRVTPVAAAGSYEDAWTRLRDTVRAAGGRAWRFHALAEPRRRLEFIEWKQSDGAPAFLEIDDVSSALAVLDAAGSIEGREQWEEST